MANYIKNRIYLSGDKKMIDQVIEKFSTHYEKEIHKAYDGRVIYKNEIENNFGWLNEQTNEFERRGQSVVIGVPDGFSIEYIAEWTRFPDFEKIIHRPEELDITSNGFLMPLENQFSSGTKFKSHLDELRENIIKNPKGKEGTVKNFIAGITNYINFGHATWYSWSVANWGTKWNAFDCVKVDEFTFDFITAWSGVPDLIEKMAMEFKDVKFIYEWSDEDTGSNCGACEFFNGKSQVNRLESQSKEAYELAFKLRPTYAENYKFINGKYEYIEDEE